MKRSFISLALAFLMLFSLSSGLSPAFAEGEDNEAEIISLDKTELAMLLGGSLEKLAVQGAPEDAAITWVSSDKRVARVSPNGYVISVSEGTATITATVGDTVLTCAVTVHSDDLLITNDVFPKDVNGDPIFAQMGSIYQYEDDDPYYYMYGMNFGDAQAYYNSLQTGNGSTSGGGGTSWSSASIRCYKSLNLVDWEPVGGPWAGDDDAATHDADVVRPRTYGWEAVSTSWIARMGVGYNAKTGKYVMVGQYQEGVHGTNRLWYAVADRPEGPFEFVKHEQAMTVGPDIPARADGTEVPYTGDMTMYYDREAGEMYIIYCINGVTVSPYTQAGSWEIYPERDQQYVARLNPDDFLSVVANYEVYDAKKDTYYNLLREGGREANCMFKYNGWYYYAASGLRGWNTSPTFYMGGAKNPTDKTYTNEVGLPDNMTPMRGSNGNFSHTTQVVGFVTADTPNGQMVLEFGDRHSNHAGYGIGYTQFAPLSFLDPATADPMTADELPKTPNPQSYNGNKDNPALVPNPWGDQESFFPWLPEGYPYDEWQRQEWPIPVYNDMTQFYYDIANGTWAPGPNNNYLDNAYFENDRLAGGLTMTFQDQTIAMPGIQTYVNEPNGWKSEHIAGQTAQINYGGNRSSAQNNRNYQLIAPGTTTQTYYSAWAGNYAWYHGYTKRNTGADPYKTRTYQTATGLPDGIYTFYGWVRSSGGQNEAYMYAGDAKVNLNTAIDDWTLLAVEGVEVADGTCEVGFYSDAAADQWLFIDDVALIKTADLPPAPSLDKTEMAMLLGGSLDHLTVQGAPEGEAITWASDDWRVARVSGGNVISVGEGTANVTARIGETVLTCVVEVYSEDLLITNDVFGLDTDGNPIFAQMGSMDKYNDGTGKYWWYGVDLPNARGYYNSLKNTKGTLGSSGQSGTHVNLYSSTNLVDWDFEGRVVTLGQNGWPSPGWFGRLGVVYNEKYGTYHMIGQGNGVFFGSAPTPQGPWTYVGAQNNLTTLGVPSNGTGDQTVFYDGSTGEAYVIFGCNGVTVPGYTNWSRNATTGIWSYGTTDTLGGTTQNFWETLPERDQIYVGILNDTFTQIVEVKKYYDAKEDNLYNLYREGGREANGMFKYDGWYYSFASGLRGWNTGPGTFYMGGSKDPKQGDFVNEVGLPNNMSAMRGSVNNNSHTTQVVSVIVSDIDKITPQAPKGQMVLQLGDRWGNQSGIGSLGYDQFNPITFVSPEGLGAPTEDDIPRVPSPKNYSVNPPPELFAPGQDLTLPGLQNPAEWADKDTFFPFLPKGYEDAMGSAEWVKPEWDIPVFNNVSQFYWDLANGAWSVGPNNNYLNNPHFENDRLAGGRDVIIGDQVETLAVIQQYVNEPNGWKADHIAGQVAQINWGGGGNGRASGTNVFRYQLGNPETYNLATGLPTQSWYSAYAGNYTWYHGYSKRNTGTDPYTTKTSQVAKNLPDGTYTFYGWFRSSGGQNEAYMYAGDAKLDLSNAIDDWTLVFIEDIAVTGGQLEVGFYSDAEADQWLYIDDLALIRNKDSEAGAEILSLEVDGRIQKLVSGYAANIPAEVTAYNPDSLKIYAGLFVDGALIQSAEVIDGKATIKATAFTTVNENVYVRAWFEGLDPEVEKAIPVAQATGLWAPEVTVSSSLGGTVYVTFASEITFSGTVTVRGVKASRVALSADGKSLEISGYSVTASDNNKIVVSKVKYPDLFPSYSFTFTLDYPG